MTNEFFTSCLHEDIDLISDQYGFWDVNMQNKDLVNLTGASSLENGIIIAILTRYNELVNNPTYSNFGSRINELIKANQNNLTLFKLEQYAKQAIQDMNRISSVNEVKITEEAGKYSVMFNVTSILDETIIGSVEL